MFTDSGPWDLRGLAASGSLSMECGRFWAQMSGRPSRMIYQSQLCIARKQQKIKLMTTASMIASRAIRIVTVVLLVPVHGAGGGGGGAAAAAATGAGAGAAVAAAAAVAGGGRGGRTGSRQVV